MDPSVKDIPSLIKWLAKKHHGGAASAMSERLGVSVSTPSFWKRGVVEPKLENLMRISEVYGVPLADVIALAGKRRRRGRLGIIAGLVALGGLAPTPSAAGPPITPSVVQVLDNMLLIRLRLRRLLDWLARPLLPLGCPA